MHDADCILVFQVTSAQLKMSSRKFPPQERLGDFIQNREASQDVVEILHKFLCAYEPTFRSTIINAQLTQFYNRTSVHLAAEKGVAPFLCILLQHGGEFIVKLCVNHTHECK